MESSNICSNGRPDALTTRSRRCPRACRPRLQRLRGSRSHRDSPPHRSRLAPWPKATRWRRLVMRLLQPLGDSERPIRVSPRFVSGDGCLSKSHRGVWRLRISADAQYPGIIEECAAAMEAIFPAQRAHQVRRRRSRCVDISMYSKHWPCLFPQHGAGRKHHRVIELATWQREVVEETPEQFLRGLIHSDGCRIIAHERQAGRERDAPRYIFSNRSEDIKRLFCESCDALGIRWTRPSDREIAIYRLSSVARMDQFVGPKT